MGSSPLARGTRSSTSPPGSCAGLIPARAGNTSSPQRRQGSGGAHPRSRGEHSQVAAYVRLDSGSSPLARGTLGPCEVGNHRRGLIPARAGNTTSPCCSPHLRRAHPRSRGEHEIQDYDGIPLGGSSPLARGTRVCRLPFCPEGGLIPARAGNTVRWCPGTRRAGAHPRSRGEHSSNT